MIGTLTRYPDFATNLIPPRHVEVWCPPGYAENPSRRYPVIYMHDGQNLFEPDTAYGKVDWGIDEALTQLMQAGDTDGAIVVGVWNGGEQRWREYMPQKPVEMRSLNQIQSRFIEKAGGMPYSDRYLQFLVTELKPFIDAHYCTRPEQPHTFVMGSSMGGLISLYALTEYPQVFGGAGCVSTHWPAGEKALVNYFIRRLPKPGTHKLYFDYGTQTLDAAYEPYQQRMDAGLRRKGFTEGVDWMTRKFEGAEHSEVAWRARVAIPLRFLLGKTG